MLLTTIIAALFMSSQTIIDFVQQRYGILSVGDEHANDMDIQCKNTQDKSWKNVTTVKSHHLE
jgi:hypothetical protein